MSFLKCFIFNLFILAYSISLYAAETQNNNVPVNTPTGNANSPVAPGLDQNAVTISKDATNELPQIVNNATGKNKQINPPVLLSVNKESNNMKETKSSKSNKSKLDIAEEELNKSIDDNYAFLEDLNLGLNDPIPIEGNPNNYVVIYLEKKPLLIELFPDKAPKTVSFFKGLVKSGFYNDTDFFRLIPNYIIQGGDPTSSGYGGTGKIRDAEISPDLTFQRGSIAMANNGDLHSDDSQFFISFDSFPWLDGKYTIFGRVVSGMAFLETLQSTFTNDGFLTENIIIERIVLASDLPKKSLIMKGKNSLSATNLVGDNSNQSNSSIETSNKDKVNTNNTSPNSQTSNNAKTPANASSTPSTANSIAPVSSTSPKANNTAPTMSTNTSAGVPK